jgi:peptidyl-tRNA hydrolase, PTH1 family
VKLIVGLGNPGPKYSGTRHNVGFDVVDMFAQRLGVGMTAEKFHAWFAVTNVGGERVALLKPTTYMNRSGQTVLASGKFYKLEASDLLVITDDRALPHGRLRMRASGSAGGHNGLQDIIDRLGTNEWSRLRIGIGEAPGDWGSHVLGRFAENEQKIMRCAYEQAVKAVECWIENGPDLTMTRFNGDPPGLQHEANDNGA